MKRALAFSSVLFLCLALPVSHAGAALDLPSTEVVVDDHYPSGSCTFPPLLPVCLGHYDPGPSDDLGDDDVNLYQGIIGLRIRFETSGTPLVGESIAPLLPSAGLYVRPGDIVIEQPVVALYDSHHKAVEEASPAPFAADLELNQTGYYVERPSGAPLGGRWGPNSTMNYTHVNFPWKVKGGDTDTGWRVLLWAWCRTERPEFATVKAVCNQFELGARVATLADVLPNVNVGGEVHEVVVEANANATAAPAADFLTSTDAPAFRGDALVGDGLPLRSPEAPTELFAINPPSAALDEAGASPSGARPDPMRTLLEDRAPSQRAAAWVNLALGAAGAGALVVALLVLYRRLSLEALRTHETRRQLLALVEAEPGVRLSEAARRVGVTHKGVDYHVHLLAKAGLLVARTELGHKRLYLNGDQPRAGIEAARAAALAHPLTSRLLALLEADPRLPRAELCARAGAPLSTVDWHLGRLRALGLLPHRGPRVAGGGGAAEA